MAQWSGDCETRPGSTVRGYRTTKINGRTLYLHRVRWEEKHGPLDEGLVLHHLCGNKGCFNPDHLAPMSREEHVLLHEHSHAGNPTCKRGHPKAEFRSYDTKYPRCRECHRLAEARRRS